MKFIFILLEALFLTACHKQTFKSENINKIEIATGGCLRGCPVIGLIIDSTLSFKYYGGYKAKMQGYYTGKATQGYWDTLNIQLKRINYKFLDTPKYGSIDGEDAEVIFYWDKQKRHIVKSIYDDADTTTKVLRWILNSYKQVHLVKSKDSLKFETTYQYMKPPKPKLDNIVFPPLGKHAKK